MGTGDELGEEDIGVDKGTVLVFVWVDKETASVPGWVDKGTALVFGWVDKGTLLVGMQVDMQADSDLEQLDKVED